MDRQEIDKVDKESDNDVEEDIVVEDDVNLNALQGGWMHLAKRSFSIFQDIARQRELNSERDETDLLNRVLSDSSRYLFLMEEIRERLSAALEEGARQPDVQEKLQRELEAFHFLILIWRLCQIVFLEHMHDFKSLTSKTFVFRLRAFRNSIGQPLNIMPQDVAAGMSDALVWQNVLRFVLIGELDEAAGLLSKLSVKRRTTSQSVDYLRVLLENAPFFTATADVERTEAWRMAVSDALMEDAVVSDREVARILRILLGTFEDWAAEGQEFSSWLSFYISRLPYCSGHVSPTALAVDYHQFSEAYGACQVNAFPPEIDSAFEYALRLDWDAMFEVLRKFFGNTWFTVHMWDLLHYSKCLIASERVEPDFASRLRQAVIVEYAESAIRCGDWLPFLRYFRFCLPEGLGQLKEILNTMDFRSSEERDDVIRALTTDGVTVALQEIFRRDAVSFVRQGDFQAALHSAQLTDDDFCIRIGNEYIQHIKNIRGRVCFLNDDKPTLLLLPDSVLQRLGVPGLVTLYEKAVAVDDRSRALSCLLQLLKRTFTRFEVYEMVGKITECIRDIPTGDLHASVYQQVRQWLMMVPLTNLKPATDSEKKAISDLHSLVCISVAWSLDAFSTSNQNDSQKRRQFPA